MGEIMAFNYKLIGQIKQAIASGFVKKAEPPVFPQEGPNPAAVNAPKPAPTSVDKSIAASRAAPAPGPTSADLAIQATRRQNALGRGQLTTGAAPGASMAAPDYASARQLDDLARSENVRAKMQNAGKYVADAARGAVGFGRSALENAATIKRHAEHATSSPLGYLAALGQRSGSPMLDSMGTALVEAQAARLPAATSTAPATAASAGPAAATAYYGYPPAPASGNYNDPYSRLEATSLQTYQQSPYGSGKEPAFKPNLQGAFGIGLDSFTPKLPYVLTPSGLQPSPPLDPASYMQRQIELDRPRS